MNRSKALITAASLDLFKLASTRYQNNSMSSQLFL